MFRAIGASLLLLVGVCQAQDDWSYPVDPFFGELHESEYPGDSFPIDVNFMPRTMATSSPIKMGDPDASWTYWPTPSYYWWDALTGAGVLHGAWQSTAMARNLRECPAHICVQTYSPNDAGGAIEFVFADITQNVRIRLVRFSGDETKGGFQVGSHWQEGLTLIPEDAFILENGIESMDCGAYDYAGDDSLDLCRIYQAVVPQVSDSTNILYGKCMHGTCSVLKVSSTTDSVTYYPDNAPVSDDDEATVVPSQPRINSTPEMVEPLADLVLNEAESVHISVSASFGDADGDPLVFSAIGLPGSLSIDSLAGVISGIPTAADANSQYEVTVIATDSFGASASGSFTMSVSAAPEPPSTPTAVISPPVPTGGGGSAGVLMLLMLASVLLIRREKPLGDNDTNVKGNRRVAIVKLPQTET